MKHDVPIAFAFALLSPLGGGSSSRHRFPFSLLFFHSCIYSTINLHGRHLNKAADSTAATPHAQKWRLSSLVCGGLAGAQVFLNSKAFISGTPFRSDSRRNHELHVQRYRALLSRQWGPCATTTAHSSPHRVLPESRAMVKGGIQLITPEVRSMLPPLKREQRLLPALITTRPRARRGDLGYGSRKLGREFFSRR